MSRARKAKISTQGGSDALQSNPFGDLQVDGLAPASSAPVIPAKPQVRKPKSKGRVEVRREKAGRGGKTVTTLREFPTHLPVQELEALSFDLKKTCACGGTLKGRVLELQGDVCERVIAELEKLGFKPVRAGG